MGGATTSETSTTATRRAARRAPLADAARASRSPRARGASRLDLPAARSASPGAMPHLSGSALLSAGTVPALTPARYAGGLGSAGSARAWDWDSAAYGMPRPAAQLDPDVWLIALPTGSGAYHSLEGAGRSGPIRVGRPYGHLRAVRPVTLEPEPAEGEETVEAPMAGARRRARVATGGLGSASAGRATTLPAPRPTPALVAAVEVETDAGIFRVVRRESILTHSDMAWALAHLETGEPESMVAIPRRQLALLLTLLPTPEDPDHPEDDPQWGWAHRLRGPWERGPLHTRGRLGRLIAFDPDVSGKGLHRACFELLGAEDVVWAVGVPCFQTGSVYELTPLGKGLHPSRWLSWPLAKGRTRAAERPRWEIARVVYRVGAPRWPLAGVVEPLGPLGVAG
ncbi:MAG TPA: hypothetical protein VFU88_20605 [Ktedonobacterales bacterium]|nr:hypothetical protein [Ktedonobacterales bacterium]